MPPTFIDRIVEAMPQIVPESARKLAVVLSDLILASNPNRLDRAQAEAILVQAFRSGRMGADELRSLSELAPAVIQQVAKRTGVGALKIYQDSLRGGLDWRFLFNALIDFPQPPVAPFVLIPQPSPPADSAHAFCKVLIEMAREEMVAAAVHRDLAMMASGETGPEIQETAAAHVAKAEALLAGAQALWNQL